MHPQKLAAVTKKKNTIDRLMENDSIDIEALKYNYTEYLEKVEILVGACQCPDETDWLAPYLEEINSFRSKIQGFIDSNSFPCT